MKIKTITLNEVTTYLGFKGVFTKANRAGNVDFVGLGLLTEEQNATESKLLAPTEYYDYETGEIIKFASYGIDAHRLSLKDYDVGEIPVKVK